MLLRFWQRYGTDILWLAALVFCGLKFTNHLPQIIDYPISDEGAYLQDGLDIPTNGVKPVYWGSLYNIWYYLGSLIIPDKIALYYAHLKLITIGIPFLFYILLRIIGLSPLVSFITAFLYLISFGNLYIFHKGNHTALFLMLLILVPGYKLHKGIHFWLLAAISILVSAFIRPELFIAFWLVMAWYIYLLIRSASSKTTIAIITILCLASTIYFSRLMFGNQNRSFYTFQSNFPVNWVKWNNINLDPDQNNAMLFKQAFGDATTIGEAFKNNPSIFLKNIIWNIGGMAENYVKLGITHFNVLIPATTRRSTFIESMIIFIFLCVLALMKNRKNKMRFIITENARWLWFAFLLLIPCTIANVLFYPRFNYIMLPIFLSFLLFPLLFFRNASINLSRYTVLGIILLAFAFMPVPSRGNTWYFAPAGKNNNLDKTPVKNCVEAINTLPLKRPVVSFLSEKAIYQYTDKLINGVNVFHEGISIEDFIQKNNLELLVVSDLFLSNNIVNQVSGFMEFLAHPEKYNFRRVNIKDTTNYLLVSNEALME